MAKYDGNLIMCPFREDGMISGEPFLKEGDTPETATQVELQLNILFLL